MLANLIEGGHPPVSRNHHLLLGDLPIDERKGKVEEPVVLSAESLFAPQTWLLAIYRTT
ncbi:hypothetical protein BDD12DRAFT_858990 [Trichophaea hybrida]|nr:hypothetical protein BDD12DRAFT_858990 [Trichophaea hybrida]